MRLFQINARNFVAGFEVEAGRVVRAAPILRRMTGWGGRQVADECRRQGWKLTEILSKPTAIIPNLFPMGARP